MTRLVWLIAGLLSWPAWCSQPPRAEHAAAESRAVGALLRSRERTRPRWCSQTPAKDEPREHHRGRQDYCNAAVSGRALLRWPCSRRSSEGGVSGIRPKTLAEPRRRQPRCGGGGPHARDQTAPDSGPPWALPTTVASSFTSMGVVRCECILPLRVWTRSHAAGLAPPEGRCIRVRPGIPHAAPAIRLSSRMSGPKRRADGLSCGCTTSDAVVARR